MLTETQLDKIFNEYIQKKYSSAQILVPTSTIRKLDIIDGHSLLEWIEVTLPVINPVDADYITVLVTEKDGSYYISDDYWIKNDIYWSNHPDVEDIYLEEMIKPFTGAYLNKGEVIIRCDELELLPEAMFSMANLIIHVLLTLLK